MRKQRYSVTKSPPISIRTTARWCAAASACVSGSSTEVALKANRQDSVAADRAEWERTIKQDKPDLRPAKQILAERGLPQKLDLEPIFKTEVDRTTHVLKLDGGMVTMKVGSPQAIRISRSVNWNLNCAEVRPRRSIDWRANFMPPRR
jgi:hypothetical protein